MRLPCFESQVSPEEEIYRMFELLTQPHIRKRIQQAMYHIIPRTWWSGEHRRVETIEILEAVSEQIGGDGHKPERSVPSERLRILAEA